MTFVSLNLPLYTTSKTAIRFFSIHIRTIYLNFSLAYDEQLVKLLGAGKDLLRESHSICT